jgi:hypothetical protein
MGSVAIAGLFKRRIAARAIQTLLLLVFSSATLNAERKYNLGATVHFSSGVESDTRFVGTAKTHYDPSFSLYPAISLQSSGPRSTLDFQYAFGWHRVQTEQKYETQSHIGTVSFSKRLSPRWNTSISNSFALSNDVQTFYALRGVLPTPEGLTFFFYPVVTNQLTTTNTLSGSVDHSFSTRSKLAFAGTYGLRHYPLAGRGLTNQRDGSASVSYSRNISEHTSWNLGYSMSTYAFTDYGDARQHAVRFGMTTELAQKTSFSLSAGVSQSQSDGASGRFGSFDTSASLQRDIKRNLVHISFSHSTVPSGLGSLSKNRTMNAGWSRAIGRVTSLSAGVSAFDGIGVLDNEFATRGGSAFGNIGFMVSRKLSVQVGGHYQRYTRPVIYQFTQKGLFVSLGYSEPNLWHSD